MSKIIISLSILLAVTTTSHGQKSTGIRFFEGSWKELISQAEKSNKPIFVDVYTDWCIPCKRMEREVFGLPEVGEFFNANFISYRINAEKGEGPRIAKAYVVKAYPTWLYLDSKGTLRSYRTDYMAAAAFVEAAKGALGQDSVSRRIAMLDARFKNGERNIAFLRANVEMRTTLQLDNTEQLDAYIAARIQSVPDTNELRFLISNSGRTWSAAIPLIARHLRMSKMPEQKEMATEFFDQTLYFVWANAVKAGDKKIAEQAWSAGDQIYPLLHEAKQLTYNHTALYHCRTLRLTAGLKEIGYRLAEKQLAVDTNFARIKDKELLEQVMEPFLSGKQDSTKIPNFAEEKRLASTQYSGKVAGLLYEVAEAFAELLPSDDAARHDAALWAKRAYLLSRNERTRALSVRLSETMK